jgi:alpha-D-ribose 1-methylphosphonate 5-phosphate C-P lyase
MKWLKMGKIIKKGKLHAVLDYLYSVETFYVVIDSIIPDFDHVLMSNLQSILKTSLILTQETHFVG